MTRIIGAIIRSTVVVMPVVVVVVTIAIVNMAMIAIGVSVKNKARKYAGRSSIGHADDRCQRKHDHDRPDQDDAASARLFQSRQH
jgi:hypothetical protein